MLLRQIEASSKSRMLHYPRRVGMGREKRRPACGRRSVKTCWQVGFIRITPLWRRAGLTVETRTLNTGLVTAIARLTSACGCPGLRSTTERKAEHGLRPRQAPGPGPAGRGPAVPGPLWAAAAVTGVRLSK